MARALLSRIRCFNNGVFKLIAVKFMPGFDLISMCWVGLMNSEVTQFNIIGIFTSINAHL